MHKACVFCLLGLALCLHAAAEMRIAATLSPLAEIVGGVAGARATVERLVPPGASPHTYSPKPSDVKNVEASSVFFWVGPGVDDWAAKLPHAHKVSALELVPDALRIRAAVEHHHEGEEEGDHEDAVWDGHFWMDPQAAKATLPGVVTALSAADPEGKATYEANAQRFAADLDALDREMTQILAPIKGKAVVAFHPSMLYLIRRYGLTDGGSIEPFPGKEPSPTYLQKLTKQLRASGAKAIFTEPTLPSAPGKVLAEAAGVKLSELDAEGGRPGRQTLRELLLYNAHQLSDALQ